MSATRVNSRSSAINDIDELERKMLQMSKNKDTRLHSQMMKNAEQTEEAVKRENEKLKRNLRDLEAEHGLGGKSKLEREKDRLDAQVFRLRREVDELDFQIKAKRKQLQARKDKLTDIERESAPILTDESPLTQKIRILENRYGS